MRRLMASVPSRHGNFAPSLAGRVCLLRRRLLDEAEECEVVMIRDGDGVQALSATSVEEVPGRIAPFVSVVGPAPRSVSLEVTLVKVGSLISH